MKFFGNAMKIKFFLLKLFEMRLKMLQFGSNFKMTEKTPQSRCLEIQQSIVDIKNHAIQNRTNAQKVTFSNVIYMIFCE